MHTRLGLYTAYSLQWGPVGIERLFARLKKEGVSRVAITDLDNLYGYPACREEAQSVGIDLICAAALTEQGEVIHAFVQDQTGYERLCLLLSLREQDSSFSYLNALKENSGNLVLATTHLPFLQALSHHSGVYAEVTPTCLKAVRSGLPLLAVDDALFLEKQDEENHRILCAIALHKTLGSLEEGDTVGKPKYLLDQRRWEEAFSSWPEAAAHTQALLAYDPFPSTLIFPTYTTKSGIPVEQELRLRVLKGAEIRYGEINDAIFERIDYELDIIGKKGFAPYFLVMHDIVRLSSRTCGRGSGAASIVSYSLFITNVDPIAHHLYFERFLSLERTDPPDIDVDFAWDERDGVFEAVLQRFGPAHCARVANHNTFRFRSALRETGRCYGLSDSQITTVEKQLFVSGLSSITDPLWSDICRVASSLEGLPKELSMHCGGLVITPRPLTCYAPICRSANQYPLLSWEKEGTEAAGFVKIDLLGNRSLAVIRDSLANLKEDGFFIDERTWNPIQDKPTIEALARGDSLGVFYIESPAMRQLQKKTGRGDFEHIVIHSSIIRPAANAFINEYVQRLKGKSWEPLHPRLAAILDETYGILCYQEDVSKTAVALAGFSEAEADRLRKVIAKKANGEKLKMYQEQFFSGCRKNQIEEHIIEAIWKMMLSFDGYSFCKPHSASYAMVSFQSAYLRVHHGSYFMAAVLSNQGGYYRANAYISEARRMGIKVAGPDINESRITYHAHQNTLFVGFMAVANLTREGMQRIVQERRRGGPFVSLQEAASRLPLCREDWVALVSSGSLDSLNPSLYRSEQLRILLTSAKPRIETTQPELFSTTIRPLPTQKLTSRRKSSEEELHREFASLSFLRDHHPLLLFSRSLQHVKRVKACDLASYENRYITLIGYQITQKQVLTKGGENMSFVSFEDETALYETVLFPQLFSKYHHLLCTQWPLVILGLVKNDEGALIVEIEHMKKLGS